MIASRGYSPAINYIKTNSRDSPRGIGGHRAMRLVAHLAKQLRIRSEPLDFAREVRTEVVIVVDDDRAARALDHAGIVKLLAIAMKRIRHKNRRTGGKRDIGDGAAARPRDHQITATQRAGDIVDKRNHVRLEREI